MDVLWSPWRYDYITKASASSAKCAFCGILQNSATDEDNFILHRAEFNFVVLNIYPYTSGHLMVVPFDHTASPVAASKASTDEMMDLVRRSAEAIAQTYDPDGMNIGMNLGKAAGAGVAEHYHMHVLPRWTGDVNFMTAIGQTRNLPESLPDTYRRLAPLF
ncbi:MAG: HIT domain-containing protein [Chloracidobacterium sp.]|nr:HIT domain-containing protein [Chloracidobacterium sp.]MCO5333652.1 HIT domain-containing protein [Pyrinomonadaceae bacterium]